jgi:hypothetical protein
VSRTFNFIDEWNIIILITPEAGRIHTNHLKQYKGIEEHPQLMPLFVPV